jgi:hypothetical protein
METLSILLIEMNNLLLNMEHGEDYKSVMMMIYSREFLKVIIHNNNQLLFGQVN